MMQKAALTIFAISCIIIGVDKFFEFLPICSLTYVSSKESMMVTGVLEILGGLGLLTKKFRLLSLILLGLIMFLGVVMHIVTKTTDFGGALFGLITAFFLLYGERKERKRL